MTKKMKSINLLLLLITLFTSKGIAQLPNGDAILGKWTNEDKTRVLEFVKNGSSYEALIKEAPDKSLAGQKQITQLQYSNNIYSGKLQLPKKGKTFPCTVKLQHNGSLELTARVGFMGRSQTWTKVQ